MEKDRGYYRYQRKQHIKRKMGILRRIGGQQDLDAWTGGGYYGVLAKGKIHCSCWMCRSKSYDSWSHSDQKMFLLGDLQVDEYLRYEEVDDHDSLCSTGEAEQKGSEGIS